jgi:hypothetical protein
MNSKKILSFHSECRIPHIAALVSSHSHSHPTTMPLHNAAPATWYQINDNEGESRTSLTADR